MPGHIAPIWAICDENSRLWHIRRATTGISRQRNAGNAPQASMFVRLARRMCPKRSSSPASPAQYASKQKGPPEGGPKTVQICRVACNRLANTVPGDTLVLPANRNQDIAFANVSRVMVIVGVGIGIIETIKRTLSAGIPANAFVVPTNGN